MKKHLFKILSLFTIAVLGIAATLVTPAFPLSAVAPGPPPSVNVTPNFYGLNVGPANTNITGSTYANSITATTLMVDGGGDPALGNTTLEDLSVQGLAYVDGPFTVTGGANFEDRIFNSGNEPVHIEDADGLRIDNDLNIRGDISNGLAGEFILDMNPVLINDSVEISGTLTNTGFVTPDDENRIDPESALFISPYDIENAKTLSIDGNIAIPVSKSIFADKPGGAEDLTINDDINVIGDANISGNIRVSGATNTIGRFYSKTSSYSIANGSSAWKESKCNANDVRVACSSYFQGAYSYGAYPYLDYCKGGAYNNTGIARFMSVYAYCFSPDG